MLIEEILHQLIGSLSVYPIIRVLYIQKVVSQSSSTNLVKISGQNPLDNPQNVAGWAGFGVITSNSTKERHGGFGRCLFWHGNVNIQFAICHKALNGPERRRIYTEATTLWEHV